MIDKIVQITAANEHLYGIGESGSLYYFSKYHCGGGKWYKMCNSPDIEKDDEKQEKEI